MIRLHPIILTYCLALSSASVGAEPTMTPLPPVDEVAPDIAIDSNAVVQVAYQQEAIPVPVEPETITADEGAWTLEQLEQLAQASNPTLAQSRARVQAARGTYVQLGL